MISTMQPNLQVNCVIKSQQFTMKTDCTNFQFRSLVMWEMTM